MNQFSVVQETEFDVLRREFQAEVEQPGCRATSIGGNVSVSNIAEMLQTTGFATPFRTPNFTTRNCSKLLEDPTGNL